MAKPVTLQGLCGGGDSLTAEITLDPGFLSVYTTPLLTITHPESNLNQATTQACVPSDF